MLLKDVIDDILLKLEVETSLKTARFHMYFSVVLVCLLLSFCLVSLVYIGNTTREIRDLIEINSS